MCASVLPKFLSLLYSLFFLVVTVNSADPRFSAFDQHGWSRSFSG